MGRWRGAGAHRRPARACVVCRRPTTRGGKVPVCRACTPGAPASTKYRSVATRTSDGSLAASRTEARRWEELLVWQRLGLIRELQRQAPRYALEVNGVHIASYVPDATYVAVDVPHAAAGAFVVEDTKSPFTRGLAPYRMKRALMKGIHGIEIYEHIERRGR